MTFEEMQLILQTVVLSQRETQAIVESNSRAVQAMLDQAATDRLTRENEKVEYESRIRLLENNNAILANTQQGVVALLESLDDDRPTILRKLSMIEDKTDAIIDRLNRG
jgi:16S rRNA U516 pseudouridylate synthase RsuA-like enzyme